MKRTLLVVLVLGCHRDEPPPPAVDAAVATRDADIASDYVGAEPCAGCHPDQHGAWRGSTHGVAGGPPGPETVAVPFDGRPLRFLDAEVRPLVRDGVWLFEVREEGAPTRVARVDAVVGAGRIHGGGTQTYFERAANGRLVMLPFDYSVSANAWFCQSASRGEWALIGPELRLRECEWPPSRSLGVEGEANCQNCHGSQIELRFDEKKRAFATTYTALHVNCESCHGSAKAHLAAPEAGMRPLALDSRDASVEVCLACHASKWPVRAGYRSGDDVSRHFAVHALQDVAQAGLTADGRVTSFAYQEGHLQSPCYTAGSMTCVDCHEPHGLGYRDVHGAPLEGRFDDRQCTGCHPSKANGHAGEQRCTDCHMRLVQPPAVGRHIPYARADHAITIPRGAEMTERYDPLKPVDALVRGLLDPPKDLAGAEALLALARPTRPDPAVRALSVMMAAWLRTPGAPLGADTLSHLRRLAGGGPAGLRAAAQAALLVVAGRPPDAALAQRVVFNLSNLQFAFSGLGRPTRDFLRALLAERGVPLDGGAFLHPYIANAALEDDDFAAAAESYLRAADNPRFAAGVYALDQNGARHQLVARAADALFRAGRTDESLARYEAARAADPRDPLVTERLCQVYFRARRREDALRCVDALLVLTPDFVQGHFLKATLYERLGRPEDAVRSLNEGLRLQPDNAAGRAHLERLRR